MEDANADTNLLVGGSLSVVGAGLGVLSVLLFFPPDTQEEPPVEAVLVPVPGGVLLEFHVRY